MLWGERVASATREWARGMPEQTITESYRAEQQRLRTNPRYGVASLGYAPLVRRLLLAGNCKSLSDYGAGKCKLRAALGESAGRFDYQPYDPAFPDYGSPRRPSSSPASTFSNMSNRTSSSPASTIWRR